MPKRPGTVRVTGHLLWRHRLRVLRGNVLPDRAVHQSEQSHERNMLWWWSRALQRRVLPTQRAVSERHVRASRQHRHWRFGVPARADALRQFVLFERKLPQWYVLLERSADLWKLTEATVLRGEPDVLRRVWHVLPTGRLVLRRGLLPGWLPLPERGVRAIQRADGERCAAEWWRRRGRTDGAAVSGGWGRVVFPGLDLLRLSVLSAGADLSQRGHVDVWLTPG